MRHRDEDACQARKSSNIATALKKTKVILDTPANKGRRQRGGEGRHLLSRSTECPSFSLYCVAQGHFQKSLSPAQPGFGLSSVHP